MPVFVSVPLALPSSLVIIGKPSTIVSVCHLPDISSSSPMSTPSSAAAAMSSTSGRTQLGRVGPLPDGGNGTGSKSRLDRRRRLPSRKIVGGDDLEFPVAKAAESRPLQMRLQKIHDRTAALPTVKPPRTRGGEGNETPKRSKEHLMAALQHWRESSVSPAQQRQSFFVPSHGSI
jgi:hypothetical protein